MSFHSDSLVALEMNFQGLLCIECLIRCFCRSTDEHCPEASGFSYNELLRAFP